MGAYTMRSDKLLVPVMALVTGVAVLAQGPTYNLGRTPTEDEIRAWDTAIGQEGKELPEGRGAATQGVTLFAQRCAMCHGQNGAGGAAPALVADEEAGEEALRRLPFATTIFSYISRSMPLQQEGSLSAEEVYAVTAFLLYRNGIIQESDVLDAESLPKIHMPKRGKWSLPPLSQWKPGELGPDPFLIDP